MDAGHRASREFASSLIIAAILVCALVYGREVLLPLSLASILAFMMTPVVGLLIRMRVPRALAVAIVLIGFVGSVAIASAVFSSQILSLTASLATYKENLVKKVEAFTPSRVEKNLVGRAAESIDAIERALKDQSSSNPQQPQVVVTESQQRGPLAIIETIRIVLGPVEMLLLTLIYTAVLLAEQYDIRDRLVRLAGVENLTHTTSALTEAGERLSRLFLIQGGVNAGFGIIVAGVLGATGVPNAALWGIATFLLRFIPFVGVFIAAIPPLFLAAAVVPGWGLFFTTLGVFVIGELVLANFVEPLLQGKHIGLSPLAIFAAASFWSVVWGPIGLLLSAPLTMCLVVLGEYVPSLSFISLLFGNRPPLAPEQEYYHRLLSNDVPAAIEAVEEALTSAPLAEVMDKTVLPALRLAARDHKARKMDEVKTDELRQTIALVGNFIAAEGDKERDTEGTQGVDTHGAAVIAIIPAHGPIDTLLVPFIASLVAHSTSCECQSVVNASGMMALSSLAQDRLDRDAKTILISTVGGVTHRQLRLLARRAALSFPNSRVLACDWGAATAVMTEADDALPPNVIECSTIAKALELLRLAPIAEQSAPPILASETALRTVTQQTPRTDVAGP